MSAILKDEEFVAVEAAVKAGIAPQPVAAAFNELSALRAELKKLGEPESYYLKAMNCPHHHRIFAAEPHSYRDLPLRLAEYGTCYRYEQSGELFGLMRVRSLNMNDAHIYCTEEQFADEFRAVNDMYLKYFKIFGLEKYQMRFSTHAAEGLGKKYVNEPELWKKTEDMVRKVLIESGINYVEVANEAAFYGPKIDVQVWSAIGREFTIATNQVDFAVPAKFGLTYRDKDNSNKTPLCIHRAPLGTHERFIGFLIEHYAGNFPLWLAPDQVRVITLNDDDGVDQLRQAHRGRTAREHGARGRGFQRDAVQGEDRQRGTIARPHDAGHRRSRHGSRRQRASPPRRPAGREAEGGSRGGYFGEHQRAAGMMHGYWNTFAELISTPFAHIALVWGIVPLYFGLLLNELTSDKANFRTALQTGSVFSGRARNGFGRISKSINSASHKSNLARCCR